MPAKKASDPNILSPKDPHTDVVMTTENGSSVHPDETEEEKADKICDMPRKAPQEKRKKRVAAPKKLSQEIQCDIFHPPLYQDMLSFTRILSIKRVFYCQVHKSMRADLNVQKVFWGDDRHTRIADTERVNLRDLKFSDPTIFIHFLEKILTPKEELPKWSILLSSCLS